MKPDFYYYKLVCLPLCPCGRVKEGRLKMPVLKHRCRQGKGAPCIAFNWAGETQETPQVDMTAEARTCGISARASNATGLFMAMKARDAAHPVKDAGHFDVLHLNQTESGAVFTPLH